MNTDNWREEIKAGEAGFYGSPLHEKCGDYKSTFRAGAEWMLDQLSATLKEKDKEIEKLKMEVRYWTEDSKAWENLHGHARGEIASLRAELEGLKEQRELCAEAVELNDDGTPNGCVYVDRNSILSAPSPQIKQP